MWRFIYEGHGHRLELHRPAFGLGRIRFHLDGTQLEQTRSSMVGRSVEFTTRDDGTQHAWKAEVRTGTPLSVRVWRNGDVVCGWTH